MTAQLAEVRQALACRLDEGGYAHSVAVAETAAQLAKRYGVDAQEAYLAGLLHDWSRDESAPSLLGEARSLGIECTAVDEAVPYLLHGRVGALSVKERFPGLESRIITAIERHTFGALGMSDLDKIVYLADTIEPGRDNPAAATLRDRIGKVDLAELFEQAYAVSVEHLIRTRRPIHPTTLDVWNDLVERRR
ncbi:MAG: bis(5'-nucleosyl)-tetraphosphatase (symmetrical) YqeK [Coriobacteriia bacterium]|jgi:predicted HD superfamily hydrolase involved in NAD metabolism|nr:bis(5'-nucleosyl)-tetraphosphatase (symmetrical) YqeK [Coriobacteriia bacterium]